MARQTNYVFLLDQHDNSRVVSFFRNPQWFHTYLRKFYHTDLGLVYAYEEDYFRAYGLPNDGMTVFNTRDLRFCISNRYDGNICKYDLNGNFIEECHVSEFTKHGCKTHSVGHYQDTYGYQGLLGPNVLSILNRVGDYFWSFEKHDKIPTFIMNPTDYERVDKDVLKKFATGELARINPSSIELYQETRKRNLIKNGQTQSI